MTMGHYATALVPCAQRVRAPLWLLLFCTMLPDLAWFLFAALGLEPTSPASFMDVTIRHLSADMIFSHSLVWVLAAAALVSAGVFAWLKDRAAALWCGGLVLGHELCDYLSGFSHEVIGLGSPKWGLNLYARSPYLAFVLEAVVAAACVAWYLRAERAAGRVIAPKKKWALIGVFVGGSLMFMPNADTSFRQYLQGGMAFNAPGSAAESPSHTGSAQR